MNGVGVAAAAELGRRGEVLAAVLPALIGMSYFAVGAVIYFVVRARRGPPHDYRAEARRSSALLGYQVRYFFFWATDPLWRLILASGVSANAVTWVAAGLGAAACPAAASGRFALAGWLFLLSGILDVMDGRLARARGQDTVAGAATDAVLDRYTDALMLVGLAVYYRHQPALYAALAALVGTLTIPYIRAKGEALGVSMQMGLMQRAERIVVLGAAVALSPLVDLLASPSAGQPRYWLTVAGLVFLAVSTNVTALTRFRALVLALRPARAGIETAPAAAASDGGQGDPGGRRKKPRPA
jgi:phosphatidylglycerophosphate synthase